jgi:hypothetical protein
LEDQDVGGRMGSEWIVWRMAGGGGGSKVNWPRTGQVAGCCECSDDPSDSGATELVIFLEPVRRFITMFNTAHHRTLS